MSLLRFSKRLFTFEGSKVSVSFFQAASQNRFREVKRTPSTLIPFSDMAQNSRSRVMQCRGFQFCVSQICGPSLGCYFKPKERKTALSSLIHAFIIRIRSLFLPIKDYFTGFLELSGEAPRILSLFFSICWEPRARFVTIL